MLIDVQYTRINGGRNYKRW